MESMSFYNGTLDIEKAIKIVKDTEKEIYYRYGFSYKGAEKKLISKDVAIKKLEERGWLDFYENNNDILINEYSENDMF